MTWPTDWPLYLSISLEFCDSGRPRTRRSSRVTFSFARPNSRAGDGFTKIKATFSIKGDAPDDVLKAIVTNAQKRSAVFDMVANGVPVEIEAVTP